jgi:hypothetical protein
MCLLFCKNALSGLHDGFTGKMESPI